MNKETRILYITIILIQVLIIIFMWSHSKSLVRSSYQAGMINGKLIKLQSFKDIYMPAQPEFEGLNQVE